MSRCDQWGLAALSAMPQGAISLSGDLARNGDRRFGTNLSNVGDLIGGVIGGFTKSMSGG